MRIHFLSVVEDGKPLRVSININCNYDCIYFYFSDLAEFVDFTKLYCDELSETSLYVISVDDIPSDSVNPYHLLQLIRH